MATDTENRPAAEPSWTTTGLCAALESALNGWLRADPQSLQSLQSMQGRVIEWQIRDISRSVFFFPGPQGIRVLAHYEGRADTVINAGLGGLLRSILGRPEDALFDGAIHIEGDTSLGQAFQDLLKQVDFDWEEQVSKLIGDVVAHQLGNGVRGMQRLFQQGSETLARDLSEYLQEEARLLPTRVEIAHFLDQVDTLRLDLDRLEARYQRLRKQIDAES